MTFTVHVLGSGSRGNSILVETSETRVLLDAGFSARQIEQRLEALEIPAATISAILITHEHRDHTQGMGVFSRRFRVPIYIARATAGSCRALLNGGEEVRYYQAGLPVELGDLTVEPFLTCHDAVDPLAVTVRQRYSGLKVGIATDLGTPTIPVRHALRGCDLLILESNHDDIMLRDGPYPWSLKSRIASRHGHLSNRAAAELGVELNHPRLGGVILAHLSQECNDPALALDRVGKALYRNGFRAHLQVALQDEPLAGIDVRTLSAAVRPQQLHLFSETPG